MTTKVSTSMLNQSGNLNITASNVSLGPVANIHITGGSSGQVLTTDGTGNLSWSTQSSGGTPGGSNTQIQYNNNGNFGGSATLTFNSATGVVAMPNVSITGNIIPTNNNTFSLGSANYVFKDVFIGPGSLYVDGSKVLEATGNTILFTADLNQNLRVSTTGTGDIELLPAGSGSIAVKGPLQIQAGKSILSTDGNAINFSDPIAVEGITGSVANTDITISALGTGHVKIDDDLIVTGNITIQGTSGNLSVTSLSVQDNIIDINAETTGAPTSNAGIRVIRGDEAATQIRYNEDIDTWQITNDGATYLSIVGTYSNGTTNLGNAASANYFIGNGALLTGLPSGTGYSNTNVAAYLPTYSGNVSASYFIGDGSQLTGLPAGYSNTNVAAYLPTYSGNVSASYFIGNGSTLTNITASNITGQVSNALIAGTVYTNSQPNITSVGTLTSLTVTNKVTAGQLQGDGGNISNIQGANVSGTVSSATSATTAGTVTTAAQPNITSVGSLTGLTVSNASGVVDFTTTANVTLGSVSNLRITGGSANFVLQTNGSGVLSWVAQSGGGGTPGGATTQIQYNNGGVFAGSANLTFDGTSLNAVDNPLLRAMLKDSGYVYFNSGTTNALNFVNGPNQRWAPNTGSQTLSITNWPPSGNLGELLIEGVNLGSSTITWPTINWIQPSGITTTNINTYLSAISRSLQTNGIDWVLLWTRDAGTTIYGKLM